MALAAVPQAEVCGGDIALVRGEVTPRGGLGNWGDTNWFYLSSTRADLDDTLISEFLQEMSPSRKGHVKVCISSSTKLSSAQLS